MPIVPSALALISVKHPLPMTDSLVYATGQSERATVWTQDEDCRGLPGRQLQARPNQAIRPTHQAAKLMPWN